MIRYIFLRLTVMIRALNCKPSGGGGGGYFGGLMLWQPSEQTQNTQTAYRQTD